MYDCYYSNINQYNTWAPNNGQQQLYIGLILYYVSPRYRRKTPRDGLKYCVQNMRMTRRPFKILLYNRNNIDDNNNNGIRNKPL